MSLSTGTKLGAYEITGRIGAGGMGEVYRATDTKLGREVAIKTLPAALASDPDRLARFEREAKLLAALNHPHIAAVYGLDDHEGSLYIAMELVEGETLEEKLKSGALEVEDALQLALQIAEALEAAHEKGVVHRDLKPANVMVTPDGVVKVLDFGLAKAFSDDPTQPGPEHSPALSLAMTQAGLVLGTAGYMSPEQASGQPTDQRADIWAFGVVVYEMLTGLPLFAGESVPHILADVLKTEPDWGRLPERLHPRLKLMLERCLTKKPRNRYHSIADARVDIQNVLANPDDAGLPVPSRQPERERAWPYAASAALAVALIAVLGFTLLRPEPLPDVVRFEISAPPGESLPFGVPAPSPDGRTLAYVVAGADGINRLHLRDLDTIETRVLPGTEGANYAFWSPDGNSLGFVTMPDRVLKIIDILAGSPRNLVNNLRGPWHGAWGPGGDVVHQGPDGTARVSAEGGVGTAAELLGEQLGFPFFLPDGERFLVYNYDTNSIELASLGSPTRSMVLANVESAPLLAPTPGGTTWLLYMRAPDLMAQAFDETSGTVIGDPRVLVNDIAQVAVPAVRPAAGVSPGGVLAYQSGSSSTDLRWQWVDRSGAQLALLPAEVSLVRPQLSPDGATLAGLRSENGSDELWTIDLTRLSATRRTFSEDGAVVAAVWSPDGTRLAFSRIGGGAERGLFILDLETGLEQRVADEMTVTSWSPDGRYLLGHTGGNAWLVPVDGGEEPLSVGSRNGNTRNAMFSPNGDYIAFSSDESGEFEVYVVPTPPAQGRQEPVSVNGGGQARWSADGSELFFLSTLDRRLLAVSVDTEDGFSAGIPQSLFTSDFGLLTSGYAIADDGERILIPGDSRAAGESRSITVVVNWWAELQ